MGGCELKGKLTLAFSRVLTQPKFEIAPKELAERHKPAADAWAAASSRGGQDLCIFATVNSAKALTSLPMCWQGAPPLPPQSESYGATALSRGRGHWHDQTKMHTMGKQQYL